MNLDIVKSLDFLLDRDSFKREPTALEILMDPTKTKETAIRLSYLDYMEDNLGISRDQMPQITTDNLDDFLIHYASKASVRKTTKKLCDIKPTQSEINEDKVIDRIKQDSDSWEKRKYIISLDGYLLDGHHDWAYGLQKDPNKEVEVYRVSIPIKKLISRTNKMKITKKLDINDQEVKKSLEIIEYILDNPHLYSEDIVEKAKRVELVTVRGKNKTFRRRQLIGSDEEDSPKQDKKVAKKEEKAKKTFWYTDINSKHKLSKLPVGIPQDQVTVDLTGDVDSKAVMRWKDPKTGKEQRAYTQEFMRKSAAQKYKRVTALPFDVDSRIIKNSHKYLKSIESTKDQSHAILAIIAHTGLRPGNRKLYRETGNRAISTLSPDNVIIKGDRVVLNFIGKSYHENNSSFKDAKVAKYLAELKKKNAGKEFLFDISTTKVADFILKKEIGLEGIKLKDLRTLKATKTAVEFLHSKEIPPPPLPIDPKEIKKLVAKKLKMTFEKVSSILNNSPAMAQKSYVPPGVISDWLKELGAEKHALIKAEVEENTDLSIVWERLREQAQSIDDSKNLEYPIDEYGEEEDVEFDIPLGILRILEN